MIGNITSVIVLHDGTFRFAFGLALGLASDRIPASNARPSPRTVAARGS